MISWVEKIEKLAVYLTIYNFAKNFNSHIQDHANKIEYKIRLATVCKTFLRMVTQTNMYIDGSQNFPWPLVTREYLLNRSVTCIYISVYNVSLMSKRQKDRTGRFKLSSSRFIWWTPFVSVDSTREDNENLQEYNGAQSSGDDDEKRFSILGTLRFAVSSFRWRRIVILLFLFSCRETLNRYM